MPKGSILSRVLFNVFIKDIFLFIKNSSLYNYADDNTVSYAHHDVLVLKDVLIINSLILIKWFFDNQMQANPDKISGLLVIP